MAQGVPPSRNRVGAEVPPSDDLLVADTGVDDAETAAGRRDTRPERPEDHSAGRPYAGHGAGRRKVPPPSPRAIL
jgi:hypothetical protein